MRALTTPRAVRSTSLRALTGVPELLLTAALALALAAPSCTSGGGGGGEDGGGEPSEHRAEAEAQLEKADEAGADEFFADEFEKQKEKIERANELLDQGENAKASTQYRLAARSLDRLVKKAEEVVKTRQSALAAQKDAEKAAKAAREAKADVDAARDFKDAQDALENAIELLKSTDTRKIESAERAFKRAEEDFEAAVEAANANRVIRDKALGEKNAMLAQKAKATEAKAEEFAPSELLRAGQTERAADADFEQSNYQRAYDAYRMAADAYASAISTAIAMEQIAKGQQPGGVAVAPPVEVGTPVPVPTPVNGGAPEPSSAGGGEGTPAVGVEDVPTPDYSDEDSFLLANYQRLAKGIRSYDPGSGEVIIEYSDPRVLKGDIIEPAGNSSDYLKFKDPFDFSGPGGQPEPQEQNPLPFVFSGNTRGYFLIPVPLTGNLTIEYGVDLGLMDPTGSMSTLLFSEAKGPRAYGVNFITIWNRNSSGNAKNYSGGIRNRKWRGSPNGWFNKLATVMMKIEMIPHPQKDDQSVLQVFYNTSEDDGSQPANLLALKGDQSGYVGFEWNRTRFTIRALSIRGKLDKTMAIERLKELGIEFTKPETGSLGPSDGARPASADAGAASPAPASGGGAKSPAGEFEY